MTMYEGEAVEVGPSGSGKQPTKVFLECLT